MYVDESYMSSRCPLHGDGCGVRIHRGLFKCTTMNKVFNADLIAAHNILLAPVTPESRRGIGGNGRRPGQGLNLQKEGCSPNLPTLSRGGGRIQLKDELCEALPSSNPQPISPFPTSKTFKPSCSPLVEIYRNKDGAPAGI
ncbi:MAG: transposase [Thaumarchaeota archaeon]|nr:transposase [Candidatus Wolframiiraptor allenii]